MYYKYNFVQSTDLNIGALVVLLTLLLFDGQIINKVWAQRRTLPSVEDFRNQPR